MTSVVEVPHARSLVTVGYDGAVAVFSLDEPRVDLLGYHEHLVNKVTVSASGAHAASCSSDYTIRIWNIATRQPVSVLRGHSDDVEDFVFVVSAEASGISPARMKPWPAPA